MVGWVFPIVVCAGVAVGCADPVKLIASVDICCIESIDGGLSPSPEFDTKPTGTPDSSSQRPAEPECRFTPPEILSAPYPGYPIPGGFVIQADRRVKLLDASGSAALSVPPAIDAAEESGMQQPTVLQGGGIAFVLIDTVVADKAVTVVRAVRSGQVLWTYVHDEKLQSVGDGTEGLYAADDEKVLYLFRPQSNGVPVKVPLDFEHEQVFLVQDEFAYYRCSLNDWDLCRHPLFGGAPHILERGLEDHLAFTSQGIRHSVFTCPSGICWFAPNSIRRLRSDTATIETVYSFPAKFVPLSTRHHHGVWDDQHLYIGTLALPLLPGGIATTIIGVAVRVDGRLVVYDDEFLSLEKTWQRDAFESEHGNCRPEEAAVVKTASSAFDGDVVFDHTGRLLAVNFPVGTTATPRSAVRRGDKWAFSTSRTHFGTAGNAGRRILDGTTGMLAMTDTRLFILADDASIKGYPNDYRKVAPLTNTPEISFFTNADPSQDLLADDNALYWRETSGGVTRIVTTAHDGGLFRSLAIVSHVSQMTQDDGHIYYGQTSQGTIEVYRLAKTGGLPTLLASMWGSGNGQTATSRGRVFWTSGDGLFSVASEGGTVERWSSVDEVTSILADDGVLWWSNANHQVFALPLN
ncbi:MAG: hypothetical protein SGI86_22405 [Deltaproteobacteria bacterium]|nr:hypothetical protein [Deltaproteobacteria bacterium]